jgi:hypothetical protein
LPPSSGLRVLWIQEEDGATGVEAATDAVVVEE